MESRTNNKKKKKETQCVSQRSDGGQNVSKKGMRGSSEQANTPESLGDGTVDRDGEGDVEAEAKVEGDGESAQWHKCV